MYAEAAGGREKGKERKEKRGTGQFLAGRAEEEKMTAVPVRGLLQDAVMERACGSLRTPFPLSS